MSKQFTKEAKRKKEKTINVSKLHNFIYAKMHTVDG